MRFRAAFVTGVAGVAGLLGLLGGAAACSGNGGGGGDGSASGGDAGATTAPAAEGFALTSPAFADGDTIPERFTCDGGEATPPLEWTGVPDDAAELVLVVEDPDAPGGTFTHWIVTGIPPEDGSLAEGAAPPTSQGTNDFGNAAWNGPCPPASDGPHDYVFRLVALDASSGVAAGVKRADLDAAIADKVVAEAGLTASYGR